MAESTQLAARGLAPPLTCSPRPASPPTAACPACSAAGPRRPVRRGGGAGPGAARPLGARVVAVGGGAQRAAVRAGQARAPVGPAGTTTRRGAEPAGRGVGPGRGRACGRDESWRGYSIVERRELPASVCPCASRAARRCSASTLRRGPALAPAAWPLRPAWPLCWRASWGGCGPGARRANRERLGRPRARAAAVEEEEARGSGERAAQWRRPHRAGGSPRRCCCRLVRRRPGRAPRRPACTAWRT